MAKARYTEKQKDEALELYKTVGPGEASRQTGIPRATISKWAQRSRVTVARSQKTEAATKAAVASFAEKRARLRERLLEQTHDLIDRMNEPHQEFVGSDGNEVIYDLPPAGAVKSYATSVGILIDKMRLELGEHTAHDRHESSSVDREIEKLLGEMDRKDAAHANGNGSRASA